MSEYILLLHEFPAPNMAVSPEEIQAVIAKYVAWRNKLAENGHMAGGYKLTDEGGRLLDRNGDHVAVADGPYSEAKEVIGGLFVIKAESYDEAVALCKDCPHLDHGRIEIRQVDQT